MNAPERNAAPASIPPSRAWIDFLLLLVASLLVFFVLVRLEVFERFAEWSRAHESLQVDEVLMAVAVLSFAIALFALRRWQDLEVEVSRRRAAEATSERLEGMLPICAGCKKIRDGQGSWVAVEEYVAARTEAAFTHGICPDCRTRLYPGLGD